MEKQPIELNDKVILVTGSPGFIGAFLVTRLLRELQGGHVVSFDNMNDYYDPALKEYRLAGIERAALSSRAEHSFVKADLADKAAVEEVFSRYRPNLVVNLAAQAGVRYSIEHPDAYIESNLIGFFNLVEACRRYPVEHFVFASSSSVYGENEKIPFSTGDKTDRPLSLYAATKKSDEVLAYSYSSLYRIPATGLRFFTVYGPAGRPDMFYYSAAQKLAAGETVRLFRSGECLRDFTYIDDIVEGIVRVMRGAPGEGSDGGGKPCAPYALYNIGGGSPVKVRDLVEILCGEMIRCGILPEDFDPEEHCAYAPMQPGDVFQTCADAADLERDYGFRPRVGLREGLRRFAEWFRDYYGY